MCARVERCVDDLVLCPCGHAMTAHDGGGCRGDRSRACRCARDRYGALEAAVDAARTRPWVSPEVAAS